MRLVLPTIQDVQSRLDEIKREAEFLQNLLVLLESGPIQTVPLAANQTVANYPVENLGLSIRAENVLLNADIRFISQLVSLSKEDLLELRSCGPVTVDEIQGALIKIGYSLTPVYSGKIGFRNRYYESESEARLSMHWSSHQKAKAVPE